MDSSPTGRRTFVLVDGENIDATLGSSVLNRRPAPDERPRWERVTAYAEAIWNQPVTGLFFLNASTGQLPTSFVQALLAMDYRPIALSGRADQKVVDIGLQRTLEALVDHDADVLLCSHDGDFVPQMQALLGSGRRVGVIALREYTNAQFTSLGLRIHDLEDDVHAFNVPLPRVRVIPLDEFDPELFLR
ncbi:NYN domain-containing protein [Nocardioides sp. MAHUQ-72]|uniref:NYN domain-containing protein n=1 Tax=unclassified Nocardioides TaxID=2615069 RepID=UPI0036169D6F